MTNYELKIHTSEKVDIGANHTYKLYLKQFKNVPCSLINIEQGLQMKEQVITMAEILSNQFTTIINRSSSIPTDLEDDLSTVINIYKNGVLLTPVSGTPCYKSSRCRR